MDLETRKDFTIILGVQEREMATPVIKSLHPLQTHIIIGKDYPSFSKLVNDAILMCPTEIVIFCSHRVRPTPKDIKILLQRIDEGYGLATLYRLGCFGFKKELVRRIGFFDERYLRGGWEDNDFYLRLQEADIAYYEDESIEYHASASLWKHSDDSKPKESQLHYQKKWRQDPTLATMTRMLPEVENKDYKKQLGQNDKNVKFKSWSESHLLNFSSWQNDYIIVNEEKAIHGKTILIFGGTGSLGHKLVDLYSQNNTIVVFSRDENKHWQMSLKYPNLKFVIGDIRDKSRVSDVIMDVVPNYIIIASAMKHIDRCEYELNETLLTNCMGTLNVLDCIQKNYTQLSSLMCAVFVSTDKACSPVNTYGLSKAMAEKAIVEYAYKLQHKSNIRLVNIRYGNILNSRGSIIEILHNIGNSNNPNYKLTHPDMTRFIMTQEESVRLINYAILKANSGDTVIPKLMSMKIQDLIELFADKYSKQINISGLRPGEKLHEALINENEIFRTVQQPYYFIVKPPFNCEYKNQTFKYDSSVPLISKDQLKEYLVFKGFCC